MTEPKRSPILTGGCQCGAVRYALYAAPAASICHCRLCQKAVGGPFAALATVDRGDLAWTSGAPALFESSSLASRGFCAACGTPLTYEGRLEPNRMEITIGSLDDPEAAPPGEQFGAESRLSWVEGLTALPACVTEAKFAGVVSYQHPDGENRSAPEPP